MQLSGCWGVGASDLAGRRDAMRCDALPCAVGRHRYRRDWKEPGSWDAGGDHSRRWAGCSSCGRGAVLIITSRRWRGVSRGLGALAEGSAEGGHEDCESTRSLSLIGLARQIGDGSV